MCGINLLLDRNKSLSSDEKIRQMSEVTRHRGPDHQSWLCLEQAREQLFMANNRLKILDLGDQANQPMQCGEKGQAGKRYSLSYNGELYNHYELKNEVLQKGYSFRSTSDTEVLLYALAEWGEKVLPRLNGMFAFAFYDQAEGRLLLARDSQGMKPLYYFNNDQFLIVSSEIKGVLASGLVEKQLNERQLYHYLRFRYAQKPETFYQDIYELLPGHYLSFRTGQPQPEIRKYPLATMNNPLEEKEDAAIVQDVEERLTDALFSHLESDRGAGIFLSGGVDSTLMLALLRNNASYNIPDCFTIVNSEKEAAWGTQDYLWASRAAKKYDARHFPLEINAAVLEGFDVFVAAQDQPIGDSAGLLTSLLSEEASDRQIKVILSGAGADEYFGGYNRHKAFKSYLQYYQQLHPFIPHFKKFGSLIPAGKVAGLRKPLRLWKKILRDLDVDPSQTFLNFLRFPLLADSQLTASPMQSFEKEAGSFEEGWMMAALEHDRKHYLVSDILALNDKASMQHGLEMRMPYLSQEVSRLAGQLPAGLLMKNGPKWILGDVLRKHGGDDFVKRKKEGFGLPFGLWVKEGKTAFMWEWLQDDHPLFQYLDKETIQQLLHRHKNGQEDFSQELFSLAVLAHWLAKEFI